jgi:hypothetical protein
MAPAGATTLSLRVEVWKLRRTAMVERVERAAVARRSAGVDIAREAMIDVVVVWCGVYDGWCRASSNCSLVVKGRLLLLALVAAV